MTERSPLGTAPALPVDFVEKLNWANGKVITMTAKAMIDGLSLHKNDNPSTRIAAYTASEERLLDIDSNIGASNRVYRNVKILQCVRQGIDYKVKDSEIGPGSLVHWTVQEGHVLPDSFEDIQGMKRESALGNLATLLTAPDLEIVRYEQVFPDRAQAAA